MSVYNKIAESWYNIRHWSIFNEELDKMSKEWDGKLLNIGCAHGADFVPFNSDKFQLFGIDSSSELILLSKKFAAKNGIIFHNCVADMRLLPFSDSSFDYVICMASLHHLLKRKERIQALKEMKRVVRKGVFLTVWDIENKDLPNEKIIEKDWNLRGQILRRKYYLYDISEFQKELEEAGFSADMWSDKRNLMALIKLI